VPNTALNIMGKNNKKKRKRSLSSDDVKASAGVDEGSSLKKAHDVSPARQTIRNPLMEQQTKFFAKCDLNDRERYEFFSPDIPNDRRAKLWMDQADVGEDLVDRYAWATPDSTAIRILKEFSPLVEIGCGSNAYWCRIAREAGVDIIGYDVNVAAGGKINSNDNPKTKSAPKSGPSYVKQGGPEVLLSNELRRSGRTLFLCYPDEDDEDTSGGNGEGDDDDDDDDSNVLPSSMGWQCLNNFTGDHVIHVGETFLDSNYSMEQAPWGRSSAPEFQQRLASEFHCLLKVELPNWLHTRDTISVWKRSTISTMVFAAEDDDDEDEEVEYRHIPRKERLPVNVAAPCLAHLLLPAPSSGAQKIIKEATKTPLIAGDKKKKTK
jgi:hypothetical protein